jgi:integrase
MARAAKILTERQAQALRPGDNPVFDGKVTGLMLAPTKTSAKTWTLRFTSPVTGKRRDMGLGTYPEVTILEARKKGLAQRRLIDKGLDPIDERNREREAAAVVAAELTFEKAARTKHEELKPGWKNEKHKKQWIATLETYVFPKIGGKKLDAITPADCADVLRTIWLDKPETASRTRQRMQAVMDWAWAHGHITANPVAVVDHLLAQQNAQVEHQPAVPWADMPAFTRTHLRSREPHDTTRAALLFLILTAARSGEIRGATWCEISPDFRLWTIPAERMKMNKSHRVPLSDQAVALLKALKEQNLHDTLVFPSRRKKGGDNTKISDMTLTKFLRDKNVASDTPGRVATAHGFRSSFRDWASEKGYTRDLADRALAHAVKDETEAAYHRTDLVNQRRPMMQAWADFIYPVTAEVIPLHAVG